VNAVSGARFLRAGLTRRVAGSFHRIISADISPRRVRSSSVIRSASATMVSVGNAQPPVGKVELPAT